MIKTLNIKTNESKYSIEIEANSIEKKLNKIIAKDKKIIFLIHR